MPRCAIDPLVVLSITAALMAIVAVACTVLCIAWSIPSWRRRLGRRTHDAGAGAPEPAGLTGWPARVAGALVSLGIAACAAVAWWGCYSVVTAMSGVAR